MRSEGNKPGNKKKNSVPGGRCFEELFTENGARRIRTADILLAKQALYQLSYGPRQSKVKSKR